MSTEDDALLLAALDEIELAFDEDTLLSELENELEIELNLEETELLTKLDIEDELKILELEFEELDFEDELKILEIENDELDLEDMLALDELTITFVSVLPSAIASGVNAPNLSLATIEYL